ncbi:MAG: hypothetical protein U0237_09160 [Thermoleophilia bacterium]
MNTVSPRAIIAGIGAAMVLFAVLRAGGMVPRAAGMSALAGGAAAAALADVVLGGRAGTRLDDRSLFGRIAVAVTCPLAVALSRVGPAWDPALLGGLAFAAGLAAAWAAVAARRRRPATGS